MTRPPRSRPAPRRPAPALGPLLRAALLGWLAAAPAAALAQPFRAGPMAPGVPPEFLPALRAPWTDSLPRPPVFPPGVRAVTVPVEVSRHCPYVSVRVNDSGPLTFLLASGLPVTVLDSRVAEALGLPVGERVRVAGEARLAGQMDALALDRLRVGAAEVRGLRVLGGSLGEVCDSLDHPVDGLLGYDFLSRFAATLDLGHGALTLTDPAAWAPPESARAVPMQARPDAPVVPALYDGLHPGWFRLHSGTPLWLALNGPFVRAHRLWRGGFRQEWRTLLGLLGQRTAYWVRSRDLRLARITLELPWAALLYPQDGDTAFDPLVDGTLGEPALELLEVTLDPVRGVAYLEPCREDLSPDPLGWSLEPREGLLVVTGVRPDGPAATAGIEVGDVLLRLNGADLEGLRPEVLRRLTRGPADTMVRFRVRRAGAERDVDILLPRP